MTQAGEQTWSVTDPAFASDQFRIYEFKVKRCPRARPHDWTCCPFAHPGEKAKRRDPRRFRYSGTACPDYRKNGACARGDSCPLAHGVFESWLHPARYKTQLCTDGPACQRRVCFFAHTESELRKPEEDPVLSGLSADLTADAAQQVLQQQQLAQTLAALLGQGGNQQGSAGPAGSLEAMQAALLAGSDGGAGGRPAQPQLLQAQLQQLNALQNMQRQQQQQQQIMRQAAAAASKDPGAGALDAAAIQKQILQLSGLLAQQNQLQPLAGVPPGVGGLQMPGAAGGLDVLATTPRASMPGSFEPGSLPSSLGLPGRFGLPDMLGGGHKPLERRLSLDSHRPPHSGGIPAWRGGDLASLPELAATGGAPASGAPGGVDATLAALMSSIVGGGGDAPGPLGDAGAGGVGGLTLPPGYVLTARKSVDNGVLARMSELAQLSDAELDRLEAQLPALADALGGSGGSARAPSDGSGTPAASGLRSSGGSGASAATAALGPPDAAAVAAALGCDDAREAEQARAPAAPSGSKANDALVGRVMSLLGKHGGARDAHELNGMVRNHSIDCLLAELPRSLSEMNLAAGAAASAAAAAGDSERGAHGEECEES